MKKQHTQDLNVHVCTSTFIKKNIPLHKGYCMNSKGN